MDASDITFYSGVSSAAAAPRGGDKTNKSLKIGLGVAIALIVLLSVGFGLYAQFGTGTGSTDESCSCPPLTKDMTFLKGNKRILDTIATCKCNNLNCSIKCNADNSDCTATCTQCQPKCDGTKCGDDGCNGTCECKEGKKCNESGVCVCSNDACGPMCATCGKNQTCVKDACVCTDSAACGPMCATCGKNQTCVKDTCVCTDSTACGPMCATCGKNQTCVKDTCVCTDSAACGPMCATCNADEKCENGVCVPAAPVPTGGLGAWFTSNLFNKLAPYAEISSVFAEDGMPLYTHADLLKAVDYMNTLPNPDYHGFGTSGTEEQNKRELAAFFANAAEEIGMNADGPVCAPSPVQTQTRPGFRSRLKTRAACERVVSPPAPGAFGSCTAATEGALPAFSGTAEAQCSNGAAALPLPEVTNGCTGLCLDMVGFTPNPNRGLFPNKDVNGFSPSDGGCIFNYGGTDVGFGKYACVSSSGKLWVGSQSTAKENITNKDTAKFFEFTEATPASLNACGADDPDCRCLANDFSCQYVGRGPTQLTGTPNYTDCSLALYGDYRLVQWPNLITTVDRNSDGRNSLYYQKCVASGRSAKECSSLFTFPGSVPPEILSSTHDARVLLWLTTLFFWMDKYRSGYNGLSCHDAILDDDIGFSCVANIINNNGCGCDGSNQFNSKKLRYYPGLCAILNTTTGKLCGDDGFDFSKCSKVGPVKPCTRNEDCGAGSRCDMTSNTCTPLLCDSSFPGSAYQCAPPEFMVNKVGCCCSWGTHINDDASACVKDAPSCPDPKGYKWSTSAGECSVQCGTGTQPVTVWCSKASDGSAADDSCCTETRPGSSQPCSPVCESGTCVNNFCVTSECHAPPYTNQYSEWSACGGGKCGSPGTQTRSVTCHDGDGDAIPATCCDAADALTRACSMPECQCDPACSETEVCVDGACVPKPKFNSTTFYNHRAAENQTYEDPDVSNLCLHGGDMMSCSGHGVCAGTDDGYGKPWIQGIGPNGQQMSPGCPQDETHPAGMTCPGKWFMDPSAGCQCYDGYTGVACQIPPLVKENEYGFPLPSNNTFTLYDNTLSPISAGTATTTDYSPMKTASGMCGQNWQYDITNYMPYELDTNGQVKMVDGKPVRVQAVFAVNPMMFGERVHRPWDSSVPPNGTTRSSNPDPFPGDSMAAGKACGSCWRLTSTSGADGKLRTLTGVVADRCGGNCLLYPEYTSNGQGQVSFNGKEWIDEKDVPEEFLTWPGMGADWRSMIDKVTDAKGVAYQPFFQFLSNVDCSNQIMGVGKGAQPIAGQVSPTAGIAASRAASPIAGPETKEGMYRNTFISWSGKDIVDWCSSNDHAHFDISNDEHAILCGKSGSNCTADTWEAIPCTAIGYSSPTERIVHNADPPVWPFGCDRTSFLNCGDESVIPRWAPPSAKPAPPTDTTYTLQADYSVTPKTVQCCPAAPNDKGSPTLAECEALYSGCPAYVKDKPCPTPSWQTTCE